MGTKMPFRPSFVAIPLSLMMVGSGIVLFMLARNPGNARLEEEPRHPVTQQMQSVADRQKLRPAPEIMGTDQTGAKVSLTSMRATKPVVVVFIKDGCPCSIESQPSFNRLAAAYQGLVEFVGVIDGGPAIARDYASVNEVRFPIVSDTTLETMKAYKAERSVYVALVATDGKIDKLWPGYSQTMLTDLNDRLGYLAGVKPKPLDLDLVPTKLTSGCLYED